MPEFMPDPVLVLHDASDLKDCLNTDLCGLFGQYPQEYHIKSEWLIALIDEIAVTRYPYNSDVQRLAEQRLGIEQQPDNSSPLSLLVYNAQAFRHSDNYKRDGFEPLTQAVIDRAFDAHAKIEVEGYNILLATVRALYNVRDIGGDPDDEDEEPDDE